MCNMNVLVTGGAGFIGSHLVDNLLRTGHQTVVIDNFFSGRIENIKQHAGEKNFRLIKGDVRNLKVVNKAVEGVDIIFHFAANASVPNSIEDPRYDFETNVLGTFNLLETAAHFSVKKFVYPSSAAVYGMPIYTPIDEKHPTNPLSPYGASKLAAEHYCKIFHNMHDLQTVSLRFFNLYGPRQLSGPSGDVITTFLELLKKREPLVIYGDGNQTRDFLYVDDAVKACLLTVRYENCSGETFNIGTGTRTTINELRNVLVELLEEKDTKVIYSDERKGDIRDSYADISKAKNMLKFEPEFSILNGLEELIRTS